MFDKLTEYFLKVFSFGKPRIEDPFSSRSNIYFDVYKKEVLDDIRALEVMCDEHPFLFERERHPLFNHLSEKYTVDYCPSSLKDFFSFDQKAEYFWLRQEIDNLLEKDGPGGI